MADSDAPSTSPKDVVDDEKTSTVPEIVESLKHITENGEIQLKEEGSTSPPIFIHSPKAEIKRETSSAEVNGHIDALKPELDVEPETSNAFRDKAKTSPQKAKSIKTEELRVSINRISPDSNEEENVEGSSSRNTLPEKSEENDEQEHRTKPGKKGELPLKVKQLTNVEFVKNAANRVKLYVLCEQRVWDDRGTGHVACVEHPGNSNTHYIVVQLEIAGAENVLESRILQKTLYQKQQETLIVWSESESCDLALSFQEKSGCDDIWTRICAVQGRDPDAPQFPAKKADDVDSYEEGEDAESASAAVAAETAMQNISLCKMYLKGRGASISLPPCEIGRLAEIERTFEDNAAFPIGREKMAVAVENELFVTKLCNVFQMCEDMDDLDSLHLIFKIVTYLFRLNKPSIIDLLLKEEHEKSVLGMLEYDPALAKPRRHREFVYEKTVFKDVLSIQQYELKEKIRHAYIVQYIQDICFPPPSIFEENMLSVLNSHLFFIRVEIVTMLMHEYVLKDLFTELKGSTCSLDRRLDLVKFLRELCTFAHALQNTGQNSRQSFFKTLIQNDVMATIEPCLNAQNNEVKSTIIDVLVMLVEYNAQSVRDYLITEMRERKESDLLLNLLLKHMLTDPDSEMSSAEQVGQCLRTILDPNNMVAYKNDKNDFISSFYLKCLPTFMKPVLENLQDGKLVKDDYYTANVCSLVVRLLTFLVVQHNFHMRSYAVRSGHLGKLLTLLKSRHQLLALHTLKLYRQIIASKDEFYLRDLMKHNMLDKVIECFLSNGARYNLLNSAIIEFFECIRQEDLKTLLKYTMEKHWSSLQSVKYSKVFQQMKEKYDQYMERERPTQQQIEAKLVVDPDDEWFNEDEPIETPNIIDELKLTSPTPARKTAAEPDFPSMIRKPAFDEDDDDFMTQRTLLPRKPQQQIRIITNTKTLIGPTLPSTSQANDRSRSPSPLATVNENEVTSSQATPKIVSPQIYSSALKTLSEYGDSDSDEDEETKSTEAGEVSSTSRDDVPNENCKPKLEQEAEVANTCNGPQKRRRTESPEPVPMNNGDHAIEHVERIEPVEKKLRSLSPPPACLTLSPSPTPVASD